MNQQELSYLAATLQEILSNENSVRKAGEEKLNQIKSQEPDKYACYLIALMQLPECTVEVKSLAAVILRRNISYTATDSQDLANQANNANLWTRLSADAKTYVKTELIKTIQACTDKITIHKICNLIIEVAGTIYDQEETVWQDLLQLLFQFVNSEQDIHVDAGLQIFNGLFSYLMDHLVKFKEDLMKIFAQTLQHKSLDINLAALQAVSNFLQIAEGKDTREFHNILPLMAQVAIKAFNEDDETVLEDVLVEFNEIAEVEPKFFRKGFKDLFNLFQPILNQTIKNYTFNQNAFMIVAKNDYTNNTIRHQPIEFSVTVVERLPNLVKKDLETLKTLLDLVFKLMIDIDEDVEESWMKPRDGFKS